MPLSALYILPTIIVSGVPVALIIRSQVSMYRVSSRISHLEMMIDCEMLWVYPPSRSGIS